MKALVYGGHLIGGTQAEYIRVPYAAIEAVGSPATFTMYTDPARPGKVAIVGVRGDQFLDAFDTFARAAETKALEVVITA